MALHEIYCPMCKGSIWLDLNTGKIIDCKKHGDEKKMDLSDFIKTQKNRSSTLENEFNIAEKDSKNRKSELDNLFKTTKKDAQEHPDKYRQDNDINSPFGWD